MGYVIVFLVAVAAGCAVGGVTLRNGRIAAANPEAWTGTYRGETPAEADAPSRSRLPPDPNPHTRKIGAAGLIGMIVGAAGLIALFAYLIWRAVDGIFSSPRA